MCLQNSVVIFLVLGCAMIGAFAIGWVLGDLIRAAFRKDK